MCAVAASSLLLRREEGGMAGRGIIYVVAAALVVAGVAHLGLRLLRLRRLLRTTHPEDRRVAARMLDLVTIGYAAILLTGIVVGFATRSAAWGVGVVVSLSVLAMIAAVVVMLVLAIRSARPR
jgi:hypothetical protein